MYDLLRNPVGEGYSASATSPTESHLDIGIGQYSTARCCLWGIHPISVVRGSVLTAFELCGSSCFPQHPTPSTTPHAAYTKQTCTCSDGCWLLCVCSLSTSTPLAISCTSLMQQQCAPQEVINVTTAVLVGSRSGHCDYPISFLSNSTANVCRRRRERASARGSTQKLLSDDNSWRLRVRTGTSLRWR